MIAFAFRLSIPSFLLAIREKTNEISSRCLSNPLQLYRAPSESLDSFVSTENAIAMQGILDNIGGNGSKTAGVGAGLIVASPSKANPDCKHLFLATIVSIVMSWDHACSIKLSLLLDLHSKIFFAERLHDESSLIFTHQDLL